MKMEPEITILSNHEDLSTAVAAYVARSAAQAISERGRFLIALSGGSVTTLLARGLLGGPAVDGSTWHVFWADERCVPLTSSESNFRFAKEELFKPLNIPREQIHTFDDTLSPDAAARFYASTLAQVFQPEPGGLPKFDLILLGMGEDGHTASLFPHHPVLTETQRWVAPVLDAPKPPPERITLTLPVINNARHIVFMATGAAKAAIVSEVLNPNIQPPTLPAQLVSPEDGELQWFIDEAAAINLKTPQRSGNQGEGI
jgi:6-phosphogluconolactonase